VRWTLNLQEGKIVELNIFPRASDTTMAGG